jgi:hypothetical protein
MKLLYLNLRVHLNCCLPVEIEPLLLFIPVMPRRIRHSAGKTIDPRRFLLVRRYDCIHYPRNIEGIPEGPFTLFLLRFSSSDGCERVDKL